MTGDNMRIPGVPWVGPIPRAWQILPILAVTEPSEIPNTGLVETNLLSLSYGNIIRKDIGTSDGLLPESFETYQIVESGMIVFRFTDLQNDKRSLRSALVRERGIITSAYLADSVHGVDPGYFAFIMRSYDIAKVFYGLGGGLRQSLKYADIRHLPIPVPPLAEQKAITGFLDQETAEIDAFIADQERLIELLGERRSALITAAVTGQIDVTKSGAAHD
jgi:type I restriction enzyme S subunit